MSLPVVHGIGKGSDPHVRPEKQKPISPLTDIRPPVYKLRIGQGRAGARRRVRMVMPSLQQNKHWPQQLWKNQCMQVITQTQVTSHTEHVSPAAKCLFKQLLSPRIVTRQVPFYPDPLLRPPARPPDLTKK